MISATTIANRAARAPRRVGGTAVVAGAALVAGGVLQPLLGFSALLLALDLVVPMPGTTWSEADDRFWHLVRRRRGAVRRARLRGRAPERLRLLEAGGLTHGRHLGVQPVALDTITGTAERSKRQAFDREFRPERTARDRWKGIWMATANGASLPPVEVYRLDGAHVVRDGHHRISVALDRGLATIDADVVELRR